MKSIQEDIKSGNYKQAYLLYGDEAYLKQQYKQNLIRGLNPDGDTMNFTRYEGKGISVQEIIDLCETMPFFSDTRVILIEDSGFFKNKSEELADYMKTLPEYVRMVFVESDVDKRNRMFKAVKDIGTIVEFLVQDDKMLMKWAAGILGKEGKRIRQSDMELLLQKTGTDMGNIRMELDKLIGYTMGRDIITTEDIEEICTTQIANKIFDMVRAVTEKNQKKALDLYYDLLTLKEQPMHILVLLARQFRQLLETRQMLNNEVRQDEMSRRLGVPSFAVRNLVSCARRYSSDELRDVLEDIVNAEEAVKSGRMEDVLSVELLIVRHSAKTVQQS